MPKQFPTKKKAPAPKPPKGVDISVPLKLTEISTMQSIVSGFRINWIEGTAEDGTDISLDVGAGCGSPWGTFTYKKDGVTRNYRFDARELARQIAVEIEQSPHRELVDERKQVCSDD
jgi:hypothetical protein